MVRIIQVFWQETICLNGCKGMRGFTCFQGVSNERMFEYYNYLVYNIRTDTNITMSLSVWRK